MIADMSVYQGNVDWAKARKQLELCIFRASVGSKEDTKYLSYAAECGIPFGVYHYCKAGTAAEAKTEAEFFYRAATRNNLKPLFFVADIEYSTQTSSTTKTVCEVFAQTLRALGAKKLGLYIGQSRYPYAGTARDEYDFIWIPRYGKNDGTANDSYRPKYECDMWQYTSVGKVDGVNANVDLNKLIGKKDLNWFIADASAPVVKEEEKKMSDLMPITTFVERALAAANRKDGYIMGARGQNPKNWSTTSWWFTQYSGSQKTKALYWRENAARVWDCQGMAEGLYNEYRGTNIDVQAKTNYAQWCDPKGSGLIPTKYRVPGAAVFWGDTASSIHHIGYLYKPVVDNNPDGDWYIIEARGVMYGVVITKLNSRKPNYWGWMTKYFDYSGVSSSTTIEVTAPDGTISFSHILRRPDKGTEVKILQEALIKLGYDLGKYGADGDFGASTDAAVKKFQADHGLEADGEFGPKSVAALNAALKNDATEEKKIAETTYKAPIDLLGKRNLKKGMSGDDVKQLQNALIIIGYNLGKWGADGDFGSDTNVAVRSFQRKAGLTVDGIFGNQSLEALKKELR